MERHWHLTPEQWKVAHAVMRGESPSRTCERLAIPESRYRRDIQVIGQRIGAHGRNELIEILRAPSR